VFHSGAPTIAPWASRTIALCGVWHGRQIWFLAQPNWPKSCFDPAMPARLSLPICAANSTALAVASPVVSLRDVLIGRLLD
jgi:hypothetical protein